MMTLKKHKFRIGDTEYDIFKCEGEGQCQCKRCRDKGIYNVSWTSWFYRLNEHDEGVLCHDCAQELLIQRRIDEENNQLYKVIESLKETNLRDKIEKQHLSSLCKRLGALNDKLLKNINKRKLPEPSMEV